MSQPSTSSRRLPRALPWKRCLGGSDVGAALTRLTHRVKAPRGLSELGVRAGDLPAVVDEVLAHPYANPRPVDRAELARLLTAAL